MSKDGIRHEYQLKVAPCGNRTPVAAWFQRNKRHRMNQPSKMDLIQLRKLIKLPTGPELLPKIKEWTPFTGRCCVVLNRGARCATTPSWLPEGGRKRQLRMLRKRSLRAANTWSACRELEESVVEWSMRHGRHFRIINDACVPSSHRSTNKSPGRQSVGTTQSSSDTRSLQPLMRKNDSNAEKNSKTGNGAGHVKI